MKALFISLLFLGNLLSAEQIPDFGSSVTFIKGDAKFSFDDTRGKSVFVLFFQSWCPICNKWAPDAIKQLQEAHSKNEGLVLVALKADGGSPESAKSFLEAKGLDANRWLIGVDKNATYYKKVCGKDSLWGTLLVGPKGEKVYQSGMGSYFPKGNKKEYVVGTKRIYGGVTGISSSIKIPETPDLKKAAVLANVGQYEEALKICSKSRTKSDEKTVLTKQISSILIKTIEKDKQTLSSEAASAWEKFSAIRSLEGMKFMRSNELREALLLVNKAKTDKAVSLEMRAAKEYEKIMAKYKPTSKRSVESTQRYLKNLSKNYADTHYGKLAAKGLK
ncbi:MAG: TlpA family protein disulfide reductase [Lentisphaeraceae bacterium]|nr:TlpA family protein disulfide reductase [Lentisphaeraceae bacterium]